MFAKLLVPLDRSLLAEEAIGYAAALARRCEAELDLVVVHEPFPHVDPDDPLWTEADISNVAPAALDLTKQTGAAHSFRMPPIMRLRNSVSISRKVYFDTTNCWCEDQLKHAELIIGVNTLGEE